MKYGHWPFRLDRSDAPPIIVYITIAHNATAQAVIEAATLDAIPFINTHPTAPTFISFAITLRWLPPSFSVRRRRSAGATLAPHCVRCSAGEWW